MEDNEKLETVSSEPDETNAETPSDEKPATDAPAEENPPDKPKKFWERHPTAQKILQGAGVAAICGGILLLLKNLSHGNTSESTAAMTDESCYPNASADEPCSTSVQISDDVSISEQCQEEVEYEKVIGTVAGHLMKLAKGKHASEAKIQEAHENGFKDVPDDMTYRSEHPREYQTRK